MGQRYRATCRWTGDPYRPHPPTSAALKGNMPNTCPDRANHDRGDPCLPRSTAVTWVAGGLDSVPPAPLSRAADQACDLRETPDLCDLGFCAVVRLCAGGGGHLRLSVPNTCRRSISPCAPASLSCHALGEGRRATSTTAGPSRISASGIGHHQCSQKAARPWVLSRPAQKMPRRSRTAPTTWPTRRIAQRLALRPRDRRRPRRQPHR